MEFSLSMTSIYADAGFRDEEYLRDVADDWLWQDQNSAREAGLMNLARKIQDKRRELKRIVRGSSENGS